MNKECGTCGENKPISAFDISRPGKNGPIYRKHCKACRKHPELRKSRICRGDDCSVVIPAKTHALRLYCSSRCSKRASDRAKRLHSYGGSLDMYAEMFAAQDGKCAICEAPPLAGRALSFDHCHVRGKPRALLCITCNTGLGSFKDDPALLQAAIRYLEFHSRVEGEPR